MKLSVLLILFVALRGLISCTPTLPSPPLFMTADSLSEDYPDSALVLLQGVDVTDLSDSEQAEYALLMVQVMDKNGMPCYNDSLIGVAVNYYEGKSWEIKRQAKAYYYLGRVCESLGDDVAAIDAYLQALNVMDGQEVSKLHLLANINLASCYFYQDMYGRSMERCRKACHIGKELNDASGLFYPFRAIGNIHVALNQLDSALIYYHKSLQVAEKAGDPAYKATIYYDFAQYYNMRKMYREANKCISCAIGLSPQHEQAYYYLKGDILSKYNQYDSAQYYLEKSLDTDNLYACASSNYALYNLQKNRGDYEQAVDYADNYILYYDSIQRQIRHSGVTKLVNDHALESHKKEVNARHQHFMLYYVIGFLVFLSVCVYVFYYIDGNKKKKLIGLQQDLMQNRSQLVRLHNKLASSTAEIEMERQENEATQQQLQLRQKELCMLLFRTSPFYKIAQEFEAAKCQKRFLKELSEKDRMGVQQLVYEIYVDFIQQQQQSFPQLSQADVYCCVLTYMGFSNSLIGYLMGVDLNVVTQRRYRIKGKIDEAAFNLIFSPAVAAK